MTIRKMTAVAMDRTKYCEIYQENLNNWNRLPEEDATLNRYLDEI